MPLTPELEALLTKISKEKFAKKPFVPGESGVPVSGKVFDEREILLMTESVLDGWWTEGHITELFSRRLAKWLGVKYASITNSGSSANLLAFSALTSMKLGDKRLKPGDEVITVAAGFPTTVNPIIQHGMTPVFVDVELGHYNASLESIKAAASDKTRAVFMAHTLGNPYHLDKLRELCDENGWWMIEDNCDALGSTYQGKKTGTFGHIATCSFYPAHHITMGEGGAVFTSDALLYRIINSIRDWGRDCWCPTGKDNTCGRRFGWQLGNLPAGYDHKYTYSEIGYNLKVTDMQGALGLAQLERLDEFVAARKDNFKFYHNAFQPYAKYFHLPEWLAEADPSWFGFPLTVREDAPFTRAELVDFLTESKVGTRPLFAGNMLRQPYMTERDVPHRKIGELKNADAVMDRTFWIGVYPGINDAMRRHVMNLVEAFVAAAEKGDTPAPVAPPAPTPEADSKTIAKMQLARYAHLKATTEPTNGCGSGNCCKNA